MRKRLNVFTRKLIETKTVEAGISGSLFYTTHNSLHTTLNAMELILNEIRLRDFYTYKICKFWPYNERDMNFQSVLSPYVFLFGQYVLKP